MKKVLWLWWKSLQIAGIKGFHIECCFLIEHCQHATNTANMPMKLMCGEYTDEALKEELWWDHLVSSFSRTTSSFLSYIIPNPDLKQFNLISMALTHDKQDWGGARASCLQIP